MSVSQAPTVATTRISIWHTCANKSPNRCLTGLRRLDIFFSTSPIGSGFDSLCRTNKSRLAGDALNIQGNQHTSKFFKKSAGADTPLPSAIHARPRKEQVAAMKEKISNQTIQSDPLSPFSTTIRSHSWICWRPATFIICI